MTVKHSYKELLASTAVFAEMANENIDLKQILAEFILSTFSLQKVLTQTTTDVVSALNEHFEFEIPDAVVRTILKKLKNDSILSQDDGKFIISVDERKKWGEFTKKVSEKETEQNNISNQLISYVEIQKGPLNDDDKSNLLKCFSGYLFDESFEDEYSDLVSTFIIKKAKEGTLTKELNLIREGITILKGIKYNPAINEVQSWRKPLVIYLDTEHLFNIGNYNGEIYKKLIRDLLDIVKEINIEHQKNNSTKAIQFKYLEETESEIKGFFYAAKKIISSENSRGNSSVAMNTILSGASSNSDIIRKETEFFRDIHSMGVLKEEPIQLYENHHLNVEDSSIYEKYKNEFSETDIASVLRSFTEINVRRKGSNNNTFENIGYIILTGSWFKLRISSDMDAKINDGDFSFATHIYYVTQRLWFRLNRGLGFSSVLPSSLDVVAKAQILLAGHLNSSVRDRYNKLEEDVASGSRTLESVQDFYINLRSNVAKPEDIVSENVEEKVKFLYDDKDIEDFQEEQSKLKKKAEAFDKIIQDKKENDEQAEREKRNIVVSKCKELNEAAPKKYQRLKIELIIILLVFLLVFVLGIISIITINDTPLGIIGFFLAIVGTVYLVKRDSILKFLKAKAFASFEEYKTNHSVKQSELE